jgi:S1-C subfamily serine protease
MNACRIAFLALLVLSAPATGGEKALTGSGNIRFGMGKEAILRLYPAAKYVEIIEPDSFVHVPHIRIESPAPRVRLCTCLLTRWNTCYSITVVLDTKDLAAVTADLTTKYGPPFSSDADSRSWLLGAHNQRLFAERLKGPAGLAGLVSCTHTDDDVFSIPPQPQSQAAAGTGWFCSGGYIITCYHVIVGKMRITLNSASMRGVPAQAVVRDSANDIAVLKAATPGALPPGLPIAKFGATLGEKVFTIGFPVVDIMGRSAKVSDGIVSSLAGAQDDPRHLQINAAIQPGNSGGPLLNMKGEVVGIVDKKLSGNMLENVNYAIKAQYVEPLIANLPPLPNATTLTPGADSLEGLVGRTQGSIVLVIAQ